MALSPEYRGCGLGRGLMAFAEQAALDADIGMGVGLLVPVYTVSKRSRSLPISSRIWAAASNSRLRAS
ncbi:GNAT family N-acetyltransferase [Pseudomonas agarici]|uniref:GNAT family N-acetyltransferase n=1 Tax=Pseudomonas agarici TaxID=46677 RepID=UPI00115F86CA|nr:GNAT family N-acetyltransferase [Pseudomonas agarici]NWC09586.1 GNAT family N-acetyltransferase [Pseudomonas agarici]